jgi:hypothetical protein
MPPDMVPLGCGAGDGTASPSRPFMLSPPKSSLRVRVSSPSLEHMAAARDVARATVSKIYNQPALGASYSSSPRRPAACAGTDGARVTRDALKKTTKRQARRTSRPHTPATSMVLAAVQVSWSPVRLKS